jgi:hypothetical protein
MQIDQIVRVPYSTAPHMMRNTGEVFNSNPDQRFIQEKIKSIAANGNDLYGTNDIGKKLVPVAATYCGLKADTIEQLALQLEEDIAIMHQGVLVSICFCFPSSWIPVSRIGCSLMDIHKHVADGDRLVSASTKITEVMATQGSFRRHVWTISNSGDLSQHPNVKSDHIPTAIDQLYFRLETQTTAPLGDGVSSLFFVKVETCPLSTIWQNADSKRLIKDSIESMSDAVLDYKNLRHIKTILL